ncbi:hypothetical protein BV22DRAFT_932995 [Leucogyrophana mollusca]|uniref:Uncharacterized protein n=1 Tax=Leucogyrophana mollusca TaxID=85980 RepID=A0ACB8AXM5_9AGAM|nr:hypothetical protein BV22DRAFT_932995 [Leucogyrophana mollusca]
MMVVKLGVGLLTATDPYIRQFQKHDKGTFIFDMSSSSLLACFKLMRACREMTSANEETSSRVPSMLVAAR